MMKNIIQLFLLLGSANIFAFEVNTHQAITRCAITANTNKCETKGSDNLKAFATHAELLNQNYKNEKFDKYNTSYIKYAKDGKGFKDWKIKVNSNYLGLIEAGVVLEDAVYFNEDKLAKGGDGRFNNHFYSAQFDARAWCRVMGFPNLGSSDTLPFADADNMQTAKALCMGWGERTDNITWALKDGVNLGRGRVNDYGIHDAFSYFKKSFSGSEKDRKKYQAKLFVSLGFMVHLIQDLHSPAHVRDGSHSLGDYLEMYGRYDGGFNLRNGVMNPNNNHNIERAIKNFDIAKIMLRDNRYTSYQDFFRKEADWVSNNFFSEAHNAGADSYDKETGEGLNINNFFDRDSIFDNYNEHLSEGEVSYVPSATDTTGRFQYIKTDGNVISDKVKGTINPSHKVVALVEKGLFFDSEHMLAPQYGIDYNQLHKGLIEQGFDKTPLADTAINVMPRAVASTQAFINFFFRGQMEAGLSEDHTQLVVTNKSKTDLIYSSKLLTYKRGGKFTLYVEKSGVNDFVGTYTLNSDMKVNETRNINIGNIIENKGIQTGAKITVVYDGNIGDDMGGYDSYGIGMRGLSADVFTVKKNPKACKDEEKKVMEDVKWLKGYLNSRILISDIQNVYDSDLKHASHCTNTRLDYWEVDNRIWYGNCTNQRNISHAIDYFNKNIYHLVIKPPPAKDKYWARARWRNFTLNRTHGAYSSIILDVDIFKNNDLHHKESFSFIKLGWFDGSVHFNDSSKYHYDVWCTGKRDMCRYVKNRLRLTDEAYSNTPYSDWGIDWTVFDYYTHKGKIFRLLNAVSRQVEYYYARGNNPPALTHYPSDWLFKFRSWITNVDVNKCKTLRSDKAYHKLDIDDNYKTKGL